MRRVGLELWLELGLGRCRIGVRITVGRVDVRFGIRVGESWVWNWGQASWGQR